MHLTACYTCLYAIIFYLKNLVFNCLTQNVHVFRCVYYYTYMFALKDTRLWEKRDSGEIRCHATVLIILFINSIFSPIIEFIIIFLPLSFFLNGIMKKGLYFHMG